MKKFAFCVDLCLALPRASNGRNPWIPPTDGEEVKIRDPRHESYVPHNTFERGGVQFEGVIPGTSQQDSSGMKSLIIKSMFRRAHREGKCTYTPASAHLSNTTATRRGIAKRLPGEFREVAELNDLDIIGGDLRARLETRETVVVSY